MISIALTAARHDEASVVCLELRPRDQAAVWGVANDLFAGFEGHTTRRIGKISRDGVRIEIETSLPWDSVRAEIERFATDKLQDSEWIHSTNTLLSLCAHAPTS